MHRISRFLLSAAAVLLLLTSCSPARRTDSFSSPHLSQPQPPDPLNTLPDNDTVYHNDTLQYPQVLMYHLVRDDTYGDYPYLFVRPDDFASQLAALRDAGYTYRFANDYAAAEDTLSSPVILTFDDGYSCNYTYAFPLLKQYDARATIFLITDQIGTENHLTAEQIIEMYQSGYVRFGLHTASHADLRKLDEAAIREELSRGIEAFEAILGFKPDALAYPYGGYDDHVLSVTADYFTTAYTTDWPPDAIPDRMLAIPRYTVSRDMSLDSFCQMLNIPKN